MMVVFSAFSVRCSRTTGNECHDRSVWAVYKAMDILTAPLAPTVIVLLALGDDLYVCCFLMPQYHRPHPWRPVWEGQCLPECHRERR